jgi:hypothetical protein
MKQGNLTQRELDVAYYKWEFLRRNERYIRDYERIACDFTKLLPLEKIKISKYFEGEYGIYYPFNPRRKIGRKKTQILVSAFSLSPAHCMTSKYRMPSKLHHKSSSSSTLAEILEHTKQIPEEELAKLSSIDIRVNLAYTKEAMLKEVSKILDEWLPLRKKHKTILNKRLQFKEYETYLKTYDLKKKNLTFNQIASKLKRTTGRGWEDRLCKNHKACCELIDGGYRKIKL